MGRWQLSALALGLLGCEGGVAPTVRQPQEQPTTAQAAPAAGPETKGAAPGPAAIPSEIAIAPGSLLVGSWPGTAHRNAATEADAIALQVPGFSIDALPYPNDPGKPPRALTSREEARALCAAEGKRLCSELEWERACKGDAQQEYPTASFDAEGCARTPQSCASPFGVLALGTLGREWTSSEAQGALGDALRRAVVRGAAKDAAPPLHRCAARDAVTADSKSESLLFRCCRGPDASTPYPQEPAYEAFAEQELTVEQLRTLLAEMPETRAIAAEFRPFRSEDVARRLAAQNRGRSSLTPWVWTARELLWSPRRGERVAVIAGDTAQGAQLIAFHPLADGRARFATSYQTTGEHDPIVVAYKPDTPSQVLFSTCWGCGGEGGALELASDARVRIELR